MPPIDWDAKIPEITGNLAIINKTERQEDILFEKLPEATKGQPKRRQRATKGQPKRRQRVTFTPNKHTKTIIAEIREKYGSRISEFINIAIEKEAKRRK